MTPAWIALLGAVLGGAGLKAVEHWLGRNHIRIDDARQIRDELRTTITDLRAEVAALDAAVDQWRTNYYDLRDQYLTLHVRLTQLTDEVPTSHLVGDTDDGA